MSVGFCGTQYILKRKICNVCGVLWDSIYTRKNNLQCLWGSVGLCYTKKNPLQCLGFCGSLNNNFSMPVRCLWDSIY